jgi:methionyl aminopeptidase
MVAIKTDEEIEIMHKGGKILAKVIQALKNRIKPGITTRDLDIWAEDLIYAEKGIPAFKGYRGFPANICTSVNEEVVHGIPSKDKLLREGDIISLDIGIKLQEYFTDAAITLPVGKINQKLKKLIDVTKKALALGIKEAKVGNHLSDISWAIQNYVESFKFSVVREFVGHGIGKSMHEEPEVPNFGQPRQGIILKKGMVLAIEPMINMGTWEVETSNNEWTVVTKDRKASAHFEHTVAIMNKGPQILTE